MAIPTLCYTIWMTQRVGSSWLCDLLTQTGIAGKPGEHLNFPDTTAVFEHYRTTEPTEVLAKIHSLGSTENGVFGIKQGYSQPQFTNALAALNADVAHGRVQPSVSVWEAAFPNHRHIFLTRRNKLRLAVSWWKAIKSGEFHSRSGQRPSGTDLEDAYDANAIRHLLAESVAREAGIGEMLNAAGIAPLTVVYEDMVLDCQTVLDRIHDQLGIPAVVAPLSSFEVQANEISEAWVQRFRQDLQHGWTNVGW